MVRSILVTTLLNPKTGERKTLYGAYKPVSMSRAGFTTVESSGIRTYRMTDEMFVQHADDVTIEE